MKRLLALSLVLIFATPAAAARTRILAPMDWWPVASPDGTKVAFTRVYPGEMKLEITTLGAQPRTWQIAANRYQLQPSWSADGRFLAFQARGHVWLASADPTSAVLTDLGPGFSPAVSPEAGGGVAYVLLDPIEQARSLWLWTQGGTEGTRLATGVIGRPAWSPDGSRLAFQRDDGISVVTSSGQELRLAAIANPGSPSWSPDGELVAYTAGGGLFVVPADGSEEPRQIASKPFDPSPPSFSASSGRIAASYAGGVWVADLVGRGAPGDPAARRFGPGTSWSGSTLLIAASVPACPGHVGITEVRPGGQTVTVSGACKLVGTVGNDDIEATPLWGDVVTAGAGNDTVHANDGHTDRIDCGAGRDTVWADRSDRLTGCEIVHR
jgi:hypothetical protein